MLAAYKVLLGSPTDALSSAQKAAEINPEDPFAAWTLARIDMQNNAFSAAQEVIQRLLERHPDDANTYAVLGDFYTATAQFSLAEAAYRKAVDLAPEDPDILMRAGRLYYAQNKYEQAL